MNSTTSNSTLVSRVDHGNRDEIIHHGIIVMKILGGIAMAILFIYLMVSIKICKMVRALGRALMFAYHEVINWLFPCCNRTSEPTIILGKFESDSDYNPVPFRISNIYTNDRVSIESEMEMQRFHIEGHRNGT